MIIILPDFYSLTAIAGISNLARGINSQEDGENWRRITVFKSQFKTSNNFKVLSIPTVHRV